MSGYPKPLSDFGFPSSVTKVDAAVHVSFKGRTLFFVRNKYWRWGLSLALIQTQTDTMHWWTSRITHTATMKGGAEWMVGTPDSFTRISPVLALEWMLLSRTEVGVIQRLVPLLEHYKCFFKVIPSPFFQLTCTSPTDPDRSSTTTDEEESSALCWTMDGWIVTKETTNTHMYAIIAGNGLLHLLILSSL